MRNKSGPDHTSPLIAMPRGIGKLLIPGNPHVYDYQASRGEGMATELWLKGKAIGGSSSVMAWSTCAERRPITMAGKRRVAPAGVGRPANRPAKCLLRQRPGEAHVPVSMLMPATLTGTGATTDKHTSQR
ncbi:glucose-methanol-choline oxidoreductase [Stutzerimonas stutzeri TS44]|nr:glucose-methanol-choline oxidoreductase [Stutzerimonas stutzeri TS44]